MSLNAGSLIRYVLANVIALQLPLKDYLQTTRSENCHQQSRNSILGRVKKFTGSLKCQKFMLLCLCCLSLVIVTYL